MLFSAAFALFACQSNSESADGASGATWEDKISYDEEIHLEGIRQLTNGGDNAEAYFLMAQAKKGLGDIPSAKEYLSKCLENNPIEETKQQATALLNEIDSI